MKAFTISFCVLLASLLGLNAQNVGIGTTSPKAKLHVKSDQGLVTAFYDGFNEGVINSAYHEGDKKWQIITDDPPVGSYGVGAPSAMLNNETAILSLTFNTPIGKDVRIAFSANHNDPGGYLSFTLVKPGSTFYIDHQPSWKSYTTNFIATTNPSTIKFKLEAEQDVQFAETFLDEIKVTYIPDPALMIEDGSEMSGGILQSDAFGNASWVDLRSEIDQQVNQSNQDLSFITSTNRLSIENGNIINLPGLSNLQSKKLTLSVDSIISSPGMHFKIPASQNDQSNFHYDADRGSMSWGIDPISNSITNAQHSVRWGKNNKVYAEYGSVWGQDNIITFTGKNATVSGTDNSVAGYGSVAWGSNNTIESDSFGTVWGNNNKVLGNYGTAWGQYNTATKKFASAFGYKSYAYGTNSFASGYEAEAFGEYSTAIGNYARAESFGEIALGYNNARRNVEGVNYWDSNDMLLSVGNGYGKEYGHNALSILKNGYVGINKNIPAYFLDIETDEKGYQGIRITNDYNGNSTSGAIIKLVGERQSIILDAKNSFRDFEILHNTDTEKLYVKNDDDNILTITSTGEIGINESSPSYDLHLGYNSAAKPSSSSWIVASDRRLKQNIKPFEGGLDLVQKINPVWFTYNGRASMPQETGVGTIAQELERVVPYMVTDWERDGEKYKAVDYGAMDFILVNAIKEQQEQIIEYKSKVENLESELDELKAKVEALSKKLPSTHRN
ncbi:tail fiber domain-containing protein [Portibacter lacus]|uniref:Peptidase S74 domain-containing protein n=1 Tax=Portibacter lacus TaxID=1099794 RepID=A0AA37SQH4_9BACT|nr:tail fiber domain-containing protein [Portibacter lacus]GLR18182.1 hypothetical protein GCM10007940_27970 [Portibacter lacus]